MMPTPSRERFWTRPRLVATAIVSAVLAVFVAANAHLVAVAFSSQPDCALSPTVDGVATYRAAKPSC